MKRLRLGVAFLLFFTLVTNSIQAQPPYIQDDETCGCAYTESSQTAHWSAYVPIGVIVAAAIWFGVADQKRTDSPGRCLSNYSSTTSGTSGHY